MRSTLLTVSYQPEVNSLSDGLALLDAILTPHVKQSDSYPEEKYQETNAVLFGDAILPKVMRS